jgi:hypothetical protein
MTKQKSAKYLLDICIARAYIQRMTERGIPFSFRANDEDMEILVYLKKKLGVGLSQIVKMAIRKLYEQEKRREK